MADLREMYAQGDYRTCLQQAARAARINAPNTPKIDTFELALLKAECLMALRDGRTARRNLEVAQDSTDPAVARRARALDLLVRSSRGLKYAPKNVQSSGDLDISDPSNFQPAMLALLDDELAAIEPDVRRALRATDLSPMMPLVPRLLDVYALELTATAGSADRAKALGQPLGEHARELMARELEARDREISKYAELANQLVDVPVVHRHGGGGTRWWGNYGVTRRGLVSDERDRLYDLIDYLDKIEQTARKGEAIARTVDGNVQAWEQITAQADRVKQHAQETIDAEGIRTSGGVEAR
jgi:hypothetical protein